MERNDDTLRRTMRGKRYKVKGYVVIPFNRVVKAIDEDDAEDIVYNQLKEEEEVFSLDEVKVEIEEVMEED